MLFDRYEKYQKYINGVPADPPEYKKGDYLGQYDFPSLEDCEATAQYRWVETGNLICDDYSLVYEEKKQVSTDGGVTWKDTDERRPGRVMIEHAEECGWHVMDRWELVGQVCIGFVLANQYIRQYSYDMGKTWEDSDPPEYKYSLVDDFHEECVLASEPLTFEVTINSPNTLVHINVNEEVYKYIDQDDDNYQAWTRYYIDYGVDRGPELEDFYETYNDSIDGGSAVHTVRELKCKDYGYVSPGVYTIKIWGLHSTINGLSTDNESDMSYKVTSWGDFTGNVNINENYETIEDMTYTRSSSLQLVNISGNQVTALCDDLYSAFSGEQGNKNEGAEYTPTYIGLPVFIVKKAPNIGEIPVGLLIYARLLEVFRFSDTSIPSIPATLFDVTEKLYFLYRGFSNSKNLTSVPDNLFSKCLDEQKIPVINPNISDLTYIDIYLNLSRCFEGCSALQTCNIEQLHLTCDYAFKDCTSLKGQVFTGCTLDYANYLDNSGYIDKEDLTGDLNLDTETIYNLRYCFYNCTSLDSNPLASCTLGIGFNQYNFPTFSAAYMFAESSIPLFNISFFNKDIDLTRCFYKAPNIKITGEFLPLDTGGEIITTMEGYNLTEIFRQSGITTLGNIFINVTDGVNFPYGCYNCESLTTIDSLLFTNFRSYESIYQCFAYCHSLTSEAPKTATGTDVWDLYTFITNGKYDLTLAFQGSYNMTNFSSIPSEWGGAKLPDPDLKPLILEVSGSTVYIPIFGKGWIEWGDDPYMDYEDYDNHIYMQENYEDWDYSLWLPKDCISHTYEDGLTTHTVKVYFDTYSILSLRFTTGEYPNTVTHNSDENTIKIISFGSGSYDPNYRSIPIKGVEQIPGHQEIRAGSVSTITRLNQLSKLTFLGKDEGALRTFTSAESWATEMDNLEGIDPDFLASAENLNNVRYLFRYNPKLLNIPDGFLSKNTLLTNVYGLCYECESLSTIPTSFLSTCKQIQNFGEAFRGCINLTGSTPVNEDGTKWWERQGKEGYPTKITSTVCFQGCTKLDDYNDIPMSWR